MVSSSNVIWLASYQMEAVPCSSSNSTCETPRTSGSHRLTPGASTLVSRTTARASIFFRGDCTLHHHRCRRGHAPRATLSSCLKFSVSEDGGPLITWTYTLPLVDPFLPGRVAKITEASYSFCRSAGTAAKQELDGDDQKTRERRGENSGRPVQRTFFGPPKLWVSRRGRGC